MSAGHRFLGAIVLTAVLAAGSNSFAEIRSSAPVAVRHGMVVSDEARATRIGVEILKQGGNAVDAAVAVGFALAVTLPSAGNLGGGGFMLVHLAGRRQTVTIDYRETAPAAITRETFLDEKGEADPRKSLDSALAVGIPGTVAGFARAHAKYGSGKFTLSQLIQPAIRLAREGFKVEDELAASLKRAEPRLAYWPSAAKIFLKPGGVLAAGDPLVQRDLALTLEAIAREGPRVFYEGPIADKIAVSVREAGGLIDRMDLARYRAIERQPLRGTYRGHEILSMPPPSSGGVHLIEMLNILEGYDLKAAGAGSPAALHPMIEAMKIAYADRAKFLGDPAFVNVPVKGLVSKAYGAEQRVRIDPERARPASEIAPGRPAAHEGDNTTHFSVVDRDGNAVANTYSLNFSYGLGLVAEGTGILLNNELDDFAVKPGVPNAYELLGDAANAPGPVKRPLSSMTPTLVLKGGKLLLVTGSPGGSRIITTVLQVIVNVIDHGMDIAAAVAAPRIHHQWMPDEVKAEPGVAAETVRELEGRGHKLTANRAWGSADSILVTPGGLAGAADPRSRGALAAGY